jgi:endonuclease YncB( thermonuclease family)
MMVNPLHCTSRFELWACLVVVLILATTGCDRLPTQANQGTRQAANATAQLERAPLGPLEPRGRVQAATLRAMPDGVVDGDTLRAVGFDQSIRLLCLDSEERLDGDDLASATRDWEGYIRDKLAEGGEFAKYGTFLGNEATVFARAFFGGVDEVFVEYESPMRTRGYFGRHLAYVWIKKHGDETGWLNYNLEAVRAGMSPYFTKYGYSELYHDEFMVAQAEARAAQRGIWAPGAKAYRDYDARFEAWKGRADQIALYRQHFADHERFIELGTDTAMARLRQSIGERVVVFGSISRYSPRGRPPKLYLSHRFREDFTIVAPPPVRFDEFDVDLSVDQFVYVEGEVELFRGNPQITLDDKSWLRAGTNPPL